METTLAAESTSSRKNTCDHPSSRDGSLVICNVNDYQRLARTKLRKALYEYLASGTDEEQTLAENISGFRLWYLRPRVMRPVRTICTRTEICGQTLQLPVLVSPAGVMALFDEEGECAAARACGKFGTIFGLSQHATRSIEQVATVAPQTNRWYQLYILKDRALTLKLLQRAVAAGYRGIFLTVDSPVFGYREADARNAFNSLPEPHRLVNYDLTAFEETYNSKLAASWDQNSELLFDTNVTWSDLAWVKNNCSLPIIVKGIMTYEDSLLALEAGADGIMVSNHGGRQLDGSLASIDALPEVVRAVQGRVPIILDGGVRRGTDVLKALALGATAVGIGKPIFFALACGGEAAVCHVLHMLHKELRAAMTLCGVASTSDIGPTLVTRHPSGGAAVYYQRAKL